MTTPTQHVLTFCLIFTALLQNPAYCIDCTSGASCAVCDLTTGYCSKCPPGKGWKSGSCETLNTPEHCRIFVDPNDPLLDSTKCEICDNGYYLKFAGTVCESASVVAACDPSCYSCKETSEDSMTDNATGSMCQLCERGKFMLSTPAYNCGTTNTTGWYNCEHEGVTYGSCYQCPEARVSYFGQTRCDLSYTS
jgi:hypothetical protein